LVTCYVQKGCSMRCVLQRVERANIRVDDQYLSGIKKGILVFLGVEQGDKESDADYLSDKIINLRIFEDERGKMDLSLLDINGEILVVSQFTLLGDCRRGRRPSFTRAEYSDQAKMHYDYFISKVKEKVKRVAQGQFQAMMLVELVNNGPVTILLDSRKKNL
jgi:D-aminoacyl-tRNA deacylase